jgi:hypothetical protein
MEVMGGKLVLGHRAPQRELAAVHADRDGPFGHGETRGTRPLMQVHNIVVDQCLTGYPWKKGERPV